MKKEIKYNDGELIMETNATQIPDLRAVGVTAHKKLFALHAFERNRGSWLNNDEMTKVFDGVNNCTIIL